MLEALLAALMPLRPARFGSGPDLVLGDEAVAVGIGAGEARLDLRLDRRSGLGLGDRASAVAALGEKGGRGQCGDAQDDQ